MGSKNNPEQLTIRRLINTSFTHIYKKLVMGEDLDEEELVKILSIAVILTNQKELELKRLGYRIVLLYGNITGDYIPLYDISVNTGLMPVANIVKGLLNLNEKKIVTSVFIDEFTDSFVDTFRDGGIVYTEQQLVLNNFFDKNINHSMCVVAPTSYGKSELIIKTLKSYPNQSFCILVPSKSLLAQTKKRILDARIDWIEKIVTHPEMHDDKQNNAVYILTQERLSRLLNIDQTLYFDFLFVDEAHNLLEKNSRSELLATVISVANHRNSDVAIKFLTPFLKNTSSLQLRTSDSIELNYFIEEYVKSERFYIADFRDEKHDFMLYEQFTNEFYENTSESTTAISYLLEKSAQKNIVYFNRPKDIEKFVLELTDILDPIDDADVNIAIEELSNALDQEYKLIECLKKGVVYHHGSMTDTVRHYVEYLFRTSPNLKYLVSSSTLLEGVNMPIERLFLMNCKKGIGNLTASQFKNLVGRINRFSEVFLRADPLCLRKLEPEIHIVASNGYISRTANLNKFLVNRANVLKQIHDDPKNVLLEETIIDDKNKKDYDNAISRLENLENGIVDDYDEKYISTKVGALLVANSVNEIDVFAKEDEIQRVLDDIDDQGVSDTNTLMSLIFDAFIQNSDDSVRDNQLSRLEHVQAQTFYAMMLDWKIAKTPFKLMIRRFMNYWDGLYQRNKNAQVYVGKWGDETKEGGNREHYTRINRKTRKETINLAIVRIKEEEDFIEHVLFRFIDILNDLNLLEQEFFKLLKYGTTNEHTIILIRHGLSRSVAELILKKYNDFITIRLEEGIVQLDPALPDAMRVEDESFLQVFEVEMNTGVAAR